MRNTDCIAADQFKSYIGQPAHRTGTPHVLQNSRPGRSRTQPAKNKSLDVKSSERWLRAKDVSCLLFTNAVSLT